MNADSVQDPAAAPVLALPGVPRPSREPWAPVQGRYPTPPTPGLLPPRPVLLSQGGGSGPTIGAPRQDHGVLGRP